MIEVTAHLFHAAYLCVSAEETRYYLNGVYVQPCDQGGVLVVATDGHRMVVIHDEAGRADKAAIIRLDKEMLRECVASRRSELTRTLSVDVESATATLYVEVSGSPEPVRNLLRQQRDVIFNATYPDWLCVVPRGPFKGEGFPAFNATFLADMGKIGATIKGKKGTLPLTIIHDKKDGPALIRWNGIPNAFAVLMPIRADEVYSLPAFMRSVLEPQIAEAA